MKHKHRIIPGYDGGEYTEGNVIELTLTQHAMWHYAEWRRKGNKRDWLAWKMLSGQAQKDDNWLRERSRLGGLRGKGRKGSQHSEETKAKIGAKSLGRHHSEETKAKISAACKENPNVRPHPQAWSEEANEKRRLAMTGKKKTPEMRERSRLAALKRWKNRKSQSG